MSRDCPESPATSRSCELNFRSSTWSEFLYSADAEIPPEVRAIGRQPGAKMVPISVCLFRHHRSLQDKFLPPGHCGNEPPMTARSRTMNRSGSRVFAQYARAYCGPLPRCTSFFRSYRLPACGVSKGACLKNSRVGTGVPMK